MGGVDKYGRTWSTLNVEIAEYLPCLRAERNPALTGADLTPGDKVLQRHRRQECDRHSGIVERNPTHAPLNAG
jgi:hypothetical protein